MGRITSYQSAGIAVLTSLFDLADGTRSPADFERHLDRLVAAGGRAWVLSHEHLSIGYAAVSPVAGLEQVMELDGFVAPDRRREGAGSQLLARLLNDLHNTHVRQVSHAVTDLEGAAAHFLRRNHFFVEHEEQLMRLDDTAHLPPIQPVELRRFNLPRTIRLFCQLYAESFAGLPWFQPYSENEVAATLAEPEDIIFLFLGGLPIGFVWTRHSDEGFGEIEPLGIVKPYQGEGHGRALLIAALHELARRGARRVTIGAWRDNQRAVRLYESLGFRQARIFTYLALNLR